MDKRNVIHILQEIGLLLQIKGESFFKARAYFDAAKNIELSEEDIDELVGEDRLQTIQGIGTALAANITELVTTGKLS